MDLVANGSVERNLRLKYHLNPPFDGDMQTTNIMVADALVPGRFQIICGLTRVTHFIDVIMTTMASQITSLAVVCSIVYSGADQRKHQSSASLAFVRGIHRDR